MDKVKSEHLSSINSTPNNKMEQREKSPSEKEQSQQQQQQQQKQRRSRSDNLNREFLCGCGKSYLSAAALYTHVKQKHGGVNQKGSKYPSNQQNNSKNKQKKSDSIQEKSLPKQDDTEQIDQEADSRTVYDDIINFFAKNIENNSNQKLENHDGYDWISEIFPRHYFSKGTDYFKILKNLETLIKQMNYYNQINHDHINTQTSEGKAIHENKSDSQKNKSNDEKFTEDNTCQDEDESMGSPNNVKFMKKKLSTSTVQCIHKNSTATASYEDNHFDTNDIHNFNVNHLDKEQIDDNEDIIQQSHIFDDQTVDIYDIQRDIRLTSLNKIFSIFILNISTRISQQALIEILVFITLFRKALNEKGWEMCSSPLPFDHFQRSPFGQHPPHQINQCENIPQINNSYFFAKNKKNQNNNKKQNDNITSTAESSATTQSKKDLIEDIIDDKQCVLQEEEDEVDQNDEMEGDNQLQNQNNNKENNISSGQKIRNKVKVENNSGQKQQQNPQMEFCEYNSGQKVSEISNTFITECLPEYFKTAISNANELHVIGPSEEGMKNSCYIMQLLINWMYAFKFCESKLVFSDTDDETELKEDDNEEEVDENKKKRESKQTQNGRLKQNQFDNIESSHNAEHYLSNNQDVSHENLEGRVSGRFNNNLSNDPKMNNRNQLKSLYDELDDESKENRQTGNQYDLEMIGRKQRKLDLDDHNGLLHGDMNNFGHNGINFNSLSMQDNHLKLNGSLFPNYMNNSAVNSTTYNRSYSNRFFEPSSTSFFNSGHNSTTFYHPQNPFAYYNRTKYSNTYHNMDTFPRSTKFGDHDTPKVNGYPNPLNTKSMMYGNGYVTTPTSQYGFPMINQTIYPQIQPVYYPQQQVFLSPHQVINQGSNGDLFNQMGNNAGQSDFS